MTVVGFHDTDTNENGKGGISFNEAVRQIVVSRGNIETTAEDVVRQLDGAGNKSQVSSALASLRNNRETTGIVRLTQGVYSFRPESPDQDMGDVHREPRSETHVGETLRIFKSNPGEVFTSKDIINLSEIEMNIRQASQAIGNLMKGYPELERIGNGRYRWKGDKSTGVELDGVGDNIPDEFLTDAGLRVVARAQDGSRVCVDEKDVAWLVKIKVEGRLL